MSSRTKKILVFLLALDLIAVSVYFFIYKSVVSASQENQAIQAELESVLGRQASVSSIENIFRETEEDRKELSQLFISRDDVVSTISLFESFGSVSGTDIDVTSVDISEDAETGNAESLVIKASIEGNWREVTHLVSLSETAPVFMIIERLRLSYSENVFEDGTVFGSWSGDISISIPMYE